MIDIILKIIITVLLITIGITACKEVRQEQQLRDWIKVESNMLCNWSEQFHGCLCVYSGYRQTAITFARDNVCRK